MRLCGNLAMFLLLAWLAPCDSAARGKGRGSKKSDTQNKLGIDGKLSGRAGEQCTWTIDGEKQYTLKVTCLVMKQGKPRRGYTCEYTAEPTICPPYLTRSFWRQISRTLQKQKQHLCRDGHETVEVRMCKRRSANAHFRLVIPGNVIAMTTPAVGAELPEGTPTTECTRRFDHQELAREKCGNAWASFCNFLFSMVQSNDC